MSTLSNLKKSTTNPFNERVWPHNHITTSIITPGFVNNADKSHVLAFCYVQYYTILIERTTCTVIEILSINTVKDSYLAKK